MNEHNNMSLSLKIHIYKYVHTKMSDKCSSSDWVMMLLYFISVVKNFPFLWNSSRPGEVLARWVCAGSEWELESTAGFPVLGKPIVPMKVL